MFPSKGELVRTLEADNDDDHFDFIPCHWNHHDPDAQATAESTLRYTTPWPSCRRFSRTPPGTTISALDICDRDVLLGRSRSLSLYVGNKRLRDDVYSDYESYHSASKKEEKTEIAKQNLRYCDNVWGPFPETLHERQTSSERNVVDRCRGRRGTGEGEQCLSELQQAEKTKE